MKPSKTILANYYVSVSFHPTQYNSNLLRYIFSARHGLTRKEITTSQYWDLFRGFFFQVDPPNKFNRYFQMKYHFWFSGTYTITLIGTFIYISINTVWIHILAPIVLILLLLDLNEMFWYVCIRLCYMKWPQLLFL